MELTARQHVAARAQRVLQDCGKFSGSVALDDWPQCARELAYDLTGLMRTVGQSVLAEIDDGCDDLDGLVEQRKFRS